MRSGVGRAANEADAQAAPRPAAAAATAQASFSRLLRRAATGAGTPACEPPSAIHCSCSFTSCAVWKRSSGSLARQVSTTRSSAGGVIGCDARDRRRLVVHDRADEARLALAVERLLAGRHLVEHRAEREEVAARVRLAALELLGRHVLERAEDRAPRVSVLAGVSDRRQRRQAPTAARGGARRLGEPEVEQLHAATSSA